MMTQTYPELSANGQHNRIQGTDNDDRIIVIDDVLAENWGSHYVDLRNGNDALIIGGSLIGSNGFNTVVAGQGDNTLQFGGLLSEHDGLNEISSGYGNAALESTTQISIGASGISSLDNGATRIEVNGAAELNVIGDTKASDYGYTDIYLEGPGNKGITFSGNVTSTNHGALILIAEGGLHNTFTIGRNLETNGAENSFTFLPGEGELFLTISGQMRSAQGGLNEITSAQAFNYLSLEGGMKADGGTNRLVLNGGNLDLTVHGAMVAGEGGYNNVTLQGNATQHTINLLGGVQAEVDGRNHFMLDRPGTQRLDLMVENGFNAEGYSNSGASNMFYGVVEEFHLSISGGITATHNGGNSFLIFGNTGSMVIEGNMIGNASADKNVSNSIMLSGAGGHTIHLKGECMPSVPSLRKTVA